MIHDDGRCLERGCRCHMSRLQALGREIDACSWHRRHDARDPVITARPEAKPGASSSRLPCQILGDRLSSERTSIGWSQSEFASIADVERTSVQRIERGKKSNPGFSKVARLILTLHRRRADDNDGRVPAPLRRDDRTARSRSQRAIRVYLYLSGLLWGHISWRLASRRTYRVANSRSHRVCTKTRYYVSRRVMEIPASLPSRAYFLRYEFPWPWYCPSSTCTTVGYAIAT